MRFVGNILSIYCIMSFFSGKQFNTATQIEAFINSLGESYKYEEILETDPNEFNREKLCKYISSEHFKKHKQNCLDFFRQHLRNGCLDLNLKKITLKSSHSAECSHKDMHSAKLVFSIYKLLDRINKGETERMDVNFFFGQKFNEILKLNYNFTQTEFEQVIGKVACDLSSSKSFFAKGKKTKRRRTKGKGKSRSRR